MSHCGVILYVLLYFSTEIVLENTLPAVTAAFHISQSPLAAEKSSLFQYFTWLRAVF